MAYTGRSTLQGAATLEPASGLRFGIPILEYLYPGLGALSYMLVQV